MKNRFNLGNFFKTNITSVISAGSPTDSAEYSFTISDVVDAPTYLVLDFNNSANRDIFFIHRNSGNTVYYYNYNRSNPSVTHDSGTVAQVNDVAEFFNFIFDNLEDFGKVSKKTGLNIKVYGGVVNYDDESIDVADTNLTLTDNTTNYIVLDRTDNTIKSMLDISGLVDSDGVATGYVLSSVNTASGLVQSIDDRRGYNLLRGLKGDKGEDGVKWRQTYDNGTTYNIDDAVFYLGSSYICIQETTGNIPTNTTYWDVFAEKGADGTGSGDMTKATYDTDDSGVVDNAEALNGQAGSYYLSRANHTGTQTASTISDFNTEVNNNETVVDAINGVGTISGNVILDGFDLSINTDNTKFDISSGVAYVVDNFTDPANPTYTKIEFAGQTGITPAFLTTATASYPVLKTDGTIDQLSQYPDGGADLRDYIGLGAVVHSNLTNINSISEQISQNGVNLVSTVQEFANSVGRITSGNAYYPAGTDLSIAKTAGTTFSVGTNYKTSKKNPNISTDAAQNPVSDIIYSYRDGTGGWNTNISGVIDPDNYDDGTGILNTVASNKYTIQRVYYSIGSEQTLIEYGQKEYNSMALALEGIDVDSVEQNPTASNLVFRGWIVVKKGTTDLSDTDDATFLTANKFGDTSTISGGIVASTVGMQEAYNNGAEPEILTNNTRGALSIQRGSDADTDNIYEGKNGAGTVTFSVDGNGNISGNNLSGVNTGDQTAVDVDYDNIDSTLSAINTKTAIDELDSEKANKSNVLELDNITAFTPDADYEPATKKYVDDNAGGSGEEPFTTATATVDWSTSNNQEITITANTTLTLTNLPNGQTCYLKITNGGNFTVTWADTINWAGGIAPALTSDGTDIVVFKYNGTTINSDYSLNFTT